jgi:4-amino-4-deoxy-L-arabinose transferase-like glycosyltransferase
LVLVWIAWAGLAWYGAWHERPKQRQASGWFLVAIAVASISTSFAVLAMIDNSRTTRRDCERRLDPSGDFVTSCIVIRWLPEELRWINP